MTYRVFHGDALAISHRDRNLADRVRVEVELWIFQPDEPG